MAKGLRSKIMRRWRKLKRGHLGNIVQKPRLQKISNNLAASILGVEYREAEKKNAFLHPNDPEAVFPQFKPAAIVDLRSSAIPGSGRQWSGANRKTNKTVTESFANYEDVQMKSIEEEEKQEKKSVQVQKMKEEAVKGVSSHKVRKHKSRLRKTMVF